MTVKELIEALRQCPPDQIVKVDDDHGFRDPHISVQQIHDDDREWWYTTHVDGDCQGCDESTPIVATVVL